MKLHVATALFFFLVVVELCCSSLFFATATNTRSGSTLRKPTSSRRRAQEQETLNLLVQVDLSTTTNGDNADAVTVMANVAAAIEAMEGGQVEDTLVQGGIMEVTVPIGQLDAVSQIPGVT